MIRDDSPSTDQLPILNYAYTHEQTEATTGYFSCVPPSDLDFAAALARLEAAPMDDFLHQHLLRLLSAEKTEELARLAGTCYDAVNDAFIKPVLAALLLECGILLPQHAQACAGFPADAGSRLAHASPALYLRAASQPDAQASAAWSELFRGNICEHHALPHPSETGIAPLFPDEEIKKTALAMAAHADSMAAQHARLRADPAPAWERPPAQKTFLSALDALMESGTIAGPEMRHEASLSPIALLRSWQVDIEVCSGAVRHRLRGQATAYGRGMSLAAARASYAMEIVERASAYVSVGPAMAGAKGEAGQVLGRKHAMPLYKARFSELQAQGRAALDPNFLPVEAPYMDAPLHWLTAVGGDGRPVLVPAQAVFLFCNLDEPALFLAGGSTGLASGNTVDEARQAALTEIFERDAEATTPFSRSRCFRLKSRDDRIQSLLDDYAACGISVQFQDITTEFGLPAYQCFVMGRDGGIARATGANLNGQRAALAALTETPWPYSTSQSTRPRPSGPGLAGLPVRFLEDLPDYSLASPADNCRLLEAVLVDHGRGPLYVDISRKDFDLPVVRAIVPGLALTGEWDRFSRPGKRLFARYAGLFT
ncbi:MAG: bacteriocin [Desulfovibrio sp. MES5]|uniref:YcaO-like family protein n=1 Tax=Desulfovibrio sp. MES5 TaxID=1899016 RepID=UPI000B9CB9E4|nr:YcaO-like family protein [Desulfovibrio sp. MES5]OXS29852.1 MAG: bacteriocin [Desulfovibrio sp. MES5]